jgi:hypothetical protein
MASRSDPDSFQRVHDALVHDKGYQFTLSGMQRPKDPDWLIALFKFLEGAWPAIKWILLIAAAAIVLAIVVHLMRIYWPRLWTARARPAPAEQTPWRPTEAQARELLDESDAFAARGLYGEAVHLILLRSIEDLRTQRPRLVRPTLTSREIARLDALPEQARAVFAGIARVVERALFAGSEIGRIEFESCREAYRSYAFSTALGNAS